MTDDAELVAATYTAEFHGGYRATLTLAAKMAGAAHVEIAYDIWWQPSLPDGDQRDRLDAAAILWVDDCMELFIGQIRSRTLPRH